jgi:hypothetical protein
MSSAVKIHKNISGTKTYDDKAVREPPADVVFGFIGSGVIIGKSLTKTLIMTANHVVTSRQEYEDFDFMFGPVTIKTKEVKFEVSFLDGHICNAVVLSRDIESDLAVIEADCTDGSARVAEFGDKDPNVGARVWMSGAPSGIHPDNAFIVIDGLIMGNIDKINRISTIPTSGGASGSGVFHKNKIVGIIVQVMGDYEHSGIFVRLDLCRKFGLEAIKNWGG